VDSNLTVNTEVRLWFFFLHFWCSRCLAVRENNWIWATFNCGVNVASLSANARLWLTHFTLLMSDSWVSKDWTFCPERMSHTFAFLSQPWNTHTQHFRDLREQHSQHNRVNLRRVLKIAAHNPNWHCCDWTTS